MEDEKRRSRVERFRHVHDSATEQSIREPLWHETVEVKVPEEKSAKAESDEISHVLIVSSHSKIKATSAIGRGAIGAAFLGPVGLLAAASAKKKDIVTLLVIYKSGKKETVQAKVGSFIFNIYAPYIQG